VENSLMSPIFVPENRNISDLLADMLKQRMQMAIVIDEYGGTSGLTTLENLVEEIVGEIHEEHEESTSPKIVPLDNGAFMVDGKLLLEDFCEYFDIEVNDDDVDTVGGFIFNQEGAIPQIGSNVKIGELEATITEADSRRIFKVQISPVNGSPAQAEPS
jgi:CBS domain containing-hemolysin-like protein